MRPRILLYDYQDAYSVIRTPVLFMRQTIWLSYPDLVAFSGLSNEDVDKRLEKLLPTSQLKDNYLFLYFSEIRNDYAVEYISLPIVERFSQDMKDRPFKLQSYLAWTRKKAPEMGRTMFGLVVVFFITWYTIPHVSPDMLTFLLAIDIFVHFILSDVIYTFYFGAVFLCIVFGLLSKASIILAIIVIAAITLLSLASRKRTQYSYEKESLLVGYDTCHNEFFELFLGR